MSHVHSAAPPPNARADAIYAQARAGIDLRLWRAALGSELGGEPTPVPASARPAMPLDALLTVLSSRGAAPAVQTSANAAPAPDFAGDASTEQRAPGLGVNARFAPCVEDAASRTGVPGAALAAIIDAETAKGAHGQWRTDAHNPRSTAVGLGQFLAGTWQSEAQRAGTWLHGLAEANGWLGSDGAVLPSARAALLALRQDATASINATADYSRLNLDRLKQAGVQIGTDITEIAHAAYLGHNLGVRDAISFLEGGLGDARAKLLLEAQVGAGQAAQRIAAAGSAIAAHRNWLTAYIDRHVEPAHFLT